MGFIEIAEKYVDATVKKSNYERKNGSIDIKKVNSTIEYSQSMLNIEEFKKCSLENRVKEYNKTTENLALKLDKAKAELDESLKNEKIYRENLERAQAEKSIVETFEKARNNYLEAVMFMREKDLREASKLLFTKAEELDKKIKDKFKYANKTFSPDDIFAIKDDITELQDYDMQVENCSKEIAILTAKKYYYEVYGKNLEKRADLERGEDGRNL